MKCPFARGDKRLEIGNQYQPFENEGMREYFQMAQAEAPIVYNEEIQSFIVTRKKDITTIMRDVKNFSPRNALKPIKPIAESASEKFLQSDFYKPPVQTDSDPPVHPRIRQAVAPVFNKKGVMKIEKDIERIVDEFVANIRGKGTVDMVADFAYDLPAVVIFHMIGADDKDVPMIKKWADNRIEYNFGDLNEDQQNVAADNMIEFWNYCKRLVHDRMENPKDDYASFLLERRNGDDSILTIDEIIKLNFTILVAGHETTTNMTSNAIYTLMQNRDAWDAICKDKSLIPNAVEECLRLNGSIVCWRRMALKDMEFSGTVIPKGSNVLLALAGGNIDPEEFENPNQFDLHRKNAKRHVTFGHGPHVCIGEGVARTELRLILEKLTEAFPNMTLANDDPVDYIRTVAFRGPKKLMINLNE